MPESPARTTGVPSNTGNPRVTVAFPFSHIEIRDREPAASDLAALVCSLAEHVAALSHDLAPERADEADALVARANQLAASLGVR
jgi:hypothetical protein